MTTAPECPRVDLTAEFLVDPYPAYDRMRAEAPAHRVRLSGSDVEVWLVTRWTTARTLLAGSALTKSATRAGFPLETTRMPVYSTATQPLRGNMLHADAPDHGRLRRPVARVLTPVRVAALRSFVERVVDELVDRVAESGRADVVADLARPLPVRVVAELLGAPEGAAGQLHRWSRTVVAAPTAGADYAAQVQTMTEIRDYLRGVIALRHREPDGRLVDALIRERDETTGEPVLIAMPAVNRDPSRFAHPHELDLDRVDNPHISFGYGAHHCPGLHLARLEGEVAIGTLLRRLPDLELAVGPDELPFKPSLLVRGLEALPVRFTPVPVAAAAPPG